MSRSIPLAAALVLAGCLENTTGEQQALDERFTASAPGGGLDGGAGAGDKAPFAGIEGERVTLTGTVVSERVLAVDVDFRQLDSELESGRRDLGKLALQQPGEFSLEVPKGFGAVLLEAFQDVGGDGPTEDDPYGFLEVEIGDGPVTDITLTLEVGGLAKARAALTQAGGGLAWDGEDGPRVPVTLAVTSALPQALDVDLRGAGDTNAGKLKLAAPGELAFEAPQDYGELRVQAFQDLTGDGPSDDDPFGWIVLEVAAVPLSGQIDLVVGGKLALAEALGHGGAGGGAGPFDDHEGPMVLLSGTLTGVAEGAVDLDLRQLDPDAPGGNVYLGKLPLAGPGPFEFEVPARLGTLSIQAFQDQTGDGPSDDDPFGFLEIEVGAGPVRGVALDVQVGGKQKLAESLGHGGGGGPALFADHDGPMVALSGTLTGGIEGAVDLDLRRSDPDAPGGNVHVGKLKLEGTGPFSFDVPQGLGTLSIQAFQDLTGDGPSDDDPFGFLEVAIGDSAVSGVALPLEVGGKQKLAAALGHGGGEGGDAPSQPSPFADHDGPWTVVSGALTGVSQGQVELDLRVPDPEAPGGNRQLGKVYLSVEGGRYEIQVPRGLGTLMLEVFQDQTSDGPSGDDPYASATLNVKDSATLSRDLALVVGARGAPGGGGGQPQGPGGGGSVFSDLGDDPVSVSGTLSLSAAAAAAAGKAQVDLDVFATDTASEAGRTLLGKLKVEAGDFRFKAPRDYGSLELEAYVDVDGDGPTPGDPFGTCSTNPIRVGTSDVAGLVIALDVTSTPSDDG